MKIHFKLLIFITFLFFGLICQTKADFLDYDGEHNVDCSQIINYDQASYNQLKKITIHEIDRYIFVIFGWISICSSLFIIFTFYKYPDTRSFGGDIMLAISISDLVLVIHWITMSFYYFSNDGYPPILDRDNYYQFGDGFCITNAVFSTFAGTTEFLYNIMFCIYLILLIKKSKSQYQPNPKHYHGIVLILSSLFVIIAGSIEYLGISLFGTCSIKVDEKFPVMGILLLGIYLLVSWYTIYYFVKTVKQYKMFKQEYDEFLNYYFIYVIATSIIWFILAISNLFSSINCISWQNPNAEFFLTIGNAAKLCTPIVLSIIRYKNKTIKLAVRRLLSRYNIIQSSEQQQPFLNDTNNNNQDTKQLEINENGSNIITENLFGQIQQKKRIQDIYSLICGIILQKMQTRQNKTLDLKDLTIDDCKQVYQIKLSNDEISQYQNMQIKDIDVKNMQVTYYAPRVFNTYNELDRSIINIEKSFNIKENMKTIMNFASGPEGGKGGAFFLFSEDKQLLLKTMNDQEKDVLLNNLFNFVTHYSNNENSYITKIYGLFTFEGFNEKINVYLMKNLSVCPKKYILRTYDLKGSSVSRQEIKNEEDYKNDAVLCRKTLKDTDLRNTEQYLQISQAVGERCSQQLIKDATFLKELGLLDYSLLVFKVNWTGYEIENDTTMDNIKKFFKNPDYQLISSIKEPGIYYQIGLIDYLQTWDLQKQAEQQYKKLKSVDPSLDISAKEPVTYCERFIIEVAKRFMGNLQ